MAVLSGGRGLRLAGEHHTAEVEALRKPPILEDVLAHRAEVGVLC